MKLCHLVNRSVMRISGEDALSLLQGIITNNVHLLKEQTALFSALLSPQGKFLHDFFLVRDDETLLLETDTEQMSGLIKLLTMYRLRAKVVFIPLEGWHVYAAIEGMYPFPEEAIGYDDCRHPQMGRRVLSPILLPNGLQTDAYEAHRLSIGIPDGLRDMVAGRSLLLEMGYDALNAVDFAKGCYVGQEVTARSKFRGTLRKYLHRVTGEATLPPFGTDIVTEAGIVLGEMRSSLSGHGLAIIRTEELAAALANKECIQVNGQEVIITPLEWMQQSLH
jgi:tRNA-modifying protein YgfZ